MANKKQKIPIFIINLKKDTEKKQYMQELCQKFNLRMEFIEAIYGQELSDEEVSDIYSKDLAIKEIGRELSRGEIGCALSHKKIYEKMINEKMDMSLILEDDIEFDADLLKILNKVECFNEDWELILLGHHTGSSREKDTLCSIWQQEDMISGYKLVRPCEKAYGTYGYMITRNGAKKLLRYLDMLIKPIDHFTGDSICINLYAINPAPVKIHSHLSDNFNSMNERKELQNTYNSLVNNKKPSMQKRIAKLLGIHTLLVNLREKSKILIQQIKPLRKYK